MPSLSARLDQTPCPNQPRAALEFQVTQCARLGRVCRGLSSVGPVPLSAPSPAQTSHAGASASICRMKGGQVPDTRAFADEAWGRPAARAPVEKQLWHSQREAGGLRGRQLRASAGSEPRLEGEKPLRASCAPLSCGLIPRCTHLPLGEHSHGFPFPCPWPLGSPTTPSGWTLRTESRVFSSPGLVPQGRAGSFPKCKPPLVSPLPQPHGLVVVREMHPLYVSCGSSRLLAPMLKSRVQGLSLWPLAEGPRGSISSRAVR